MLSNLNNTIRVGIILVAIGVVLLLLRVTDSFLGLIFNLSPFLLLTIGYYQFKNSRSKQAYLFMLVGAVLLLFTLLRLISVLGPVLLILAGTYLLTQGKRGLSSLMWQGFMKTSNAAFSKITKNVRALFGSNNSQTSNQASSQQTTTKKNTGASSNVFFRSSHYTARANLANYSGRCIFGDLDIDLRQAKPKKAIIPMSITCLFGYVSIKIPTNWQVEIDSSKFSGNVIDHSQYEESKNKKILKLNCQCFFSDINISN